jgi:hypothetical protein
MRDNGGGPGSLIRVLATEGKTPLKDATSSSPQRAKKTTDRSKVSRNRIIAGVVGAAVVLGGIFFLTRGGDSGIPIFGGNDVPPGQVDFQVKGVTFIPYQLHGDQAAQKATAHTAAEEIRKQLDAMFEKSYIDPGTWGDTGEIEAFFTGGAKDQIAGDASTLTLGENAGDTYKSVDPKKSTIKVNVLTDAKGNAARAAATISFAGFATHTDGTYSAITVSGTAIFVRDGDTWKIEAFELNRSEKPAKAPVPTSSSPTSEAS